VVRRGPLHRRRPAHGAASAAAASRAHQAIGVFVHDLAVLLAFVVDQEGLQQACGSGGREALSAQPRWS